MTTQQFFWAGAGAAAFLFLLALAMDWKRGRRRDLDDAGWVPWRGIQVFAFFVAVICAGLAVRG